MTEELKYYKFIEEYVTEVHKPEDTGGHGLMIWVSQAGLDDLLKLLGHSFWDDCYGYKVTSFCPDGSICIEDFDNWLDMCGIDWKDVIED